MIVAVDFAEGAAADAYTIEVVFDEVARPPPPGYHFVARIAPRWVVTARVGDGPRARCVVVSGSAGRHDARTRRRVGGTLPLDAWFGWSPADARAGFPRRTLTGTFDLRTRAFRSLRRVAGDPVLEPYEAHLGLVAPVLEPVLARALPVRAPAAAERARRAGRAP